MPDPRATFPMRFRSARTRELLRAVAAQEGISQTEFAERAIEHEVVARGALLAADLEVAAERLRSLTAAQLEERIVASIDEFAQGEALTDPLPARQFVPPELAGAGGAVVAFRSAQR